MIRTQVSLDKALYDRARKVARRRGISLAEFCRRSVAEAIAHDVSMGGRPWMEYLGGVEGSSDDSTTVDAVVYDRERP